MFPFFITILLSIAGSHRARLLWLGFLGCFFYFGFANSFFFLVDRFPFITTLMLRYIIIAVLSLAAFIDGIKSIDVQKIAERFRGWKPPWVASIYFEAKMIMLLLPTFILILMPFFKIKSLSLIEILFCITIILTICLSMAVLAVTVIQFRNKRPWGYVMAPILLTVDLVLNFSTVAASIIIPILWPSVTVILLIIFLVKFKKSSMISEE
jgi:hypothetical protein